ncbi:MAG: hypothetical protein GF355_03710, partial [Candidatus Eisenbacteria bacterium]|nr:hypothetical protein [Candidatus Eisenbacteria bacterium]
SPHAGNRVWTLHLPPGLRWPDGQRVRAEDVAASLEGLLHPQTRSPHAVLFRHLLGFDAWRAGAAGDLDGLVVEDQATLRFILQEPDPHFARRLRHPAAGLVRWSRRNPFRPARGPLFWQPACGHPAPQGLRAVEWVFAVSPDPDAAAWRLRSRDPFLLTVSYMRDPDRAHAGKRILLTAAGAPPYCAAEPTPGDILARGSSLVVVLAQPAVEAEWGLTEGVRRALFRILAGSRELLPDAPALRPAEGFLPNPDRYLADLLRRLWSRPGESASVEMPERIRVFYPSGDPLLACVARRIGVLLAPAAAAPAYGLSHRALESSLRRGTYDLMLLALPVLSPVEWEAAGISLGFLAPHLHPALLRPQPSDWSQAWRELPVDPARAQPQARRLEARLLKRGVMLPVVWMPTQVVLAGAANADEASRLQRLIPDLGRETADH